MSVYFFFITFQLITIIYSIPSCNDGSNLCKFCNILTNLCAKCEISDILIPDENGGCTGAKKCIVGKNYFSSFSHEENTYIFFSVGQISVLLYKLG